MPVWEIAKSNLKHNMILSVGMSVAILLITPILFGAANLDREWAAIPLERLVSLVGIALLTPVFLPEESREIDDLVSSKYVEKNLIYLIRIATAMFLVTGFVGVFALYMRMRSCDVTGLLFAGTVADAVFLGGLGMVGASCSGSTVMGYMAAFVCYGINCGAGTKLGRFYLFSMCVSEFSPKIWLFLTGILLILASLTVERIKASPCG